MTKIYSAAFLIFLFACNAATEQKAAGSPAGIKDPGIIKPAVTDSLSGCYQMIIEKDSAYMNLLLRGDSLSGPLDYKRFQKDANTGYVHLRLNKNRWEGWYDFRSEGKASVREIIFKYENGELAEAYGDVQMKGDSVFYKYSSVLNFERGHPFRENGL